MAERTPAIGTNSGGEITFTSHDALLSFARETSSNLAGALAFLAKHHDGDYDVNATLAMALDQAWQLEQAIDLIAPKAPATGHNARVNPVQSCRENYTRRGIERECWGRRNRS